MKKKLSHLAAIIAAGLVLTIAPNGPVMAENEDLPSIPSIRSETLADPQRMTAIAIPTVLHDSPQTKNYISEPKIIVEYKKNSTNDSTTVNKTIEDNVKEIVEGKNNENNDSVSDNQISGTNAEESTSGNNDNPLNNDSQSVDKTKSSNNQENKENNLNEEGLNNKKSSTSSNSSALTESNADSNSSTSTSSKTKSAAPKKKTSSNNSSSSKTSAKPTSSTLKKNSTVKHYGNMKTIKAGNESSTIVKVNGNGTIPLVLTRNSKSAAPNLPTYISVICPSGSVYSGAFNTSRGETIVKNIPYSGNCSIKAKTSYPTSKWNGTYNGVNISYGKQSNSNGKSYSTKASWKTKPVSNSSNFTMKSPKGFSGSIVLKLTGCSSPGGATDNTAKNACNGHIQRKVGSSGKFEILNNGKVVKTQNFNISNEKHHETLTIPVKNLNSPNITIRVTKTSGPAVLVHGPGSSIVGTH